MNRRELVLGLAMALLILVAITWAAYAALDQNGQCDAIGAAQVAVGPLMADTPYPVPTEAVGGSYALVEGTDAGTPVVVLAPCP